MKTYKFLIAAISVVAALAATNASGQNVSATFLGYENGLIIRGSIDNGNTEWDISSGVSKFSTFDAFCVEPFEILNPNEVMVYQTEVISTLENSTKISKLVGGYLKSSQSAFEAAAVQWAIWEVVAENILSPSLNDGLVRITGTGPNATTVRLLANDYLINVDSFAVAPLTYLTHPDRQNVVVFVPEPGSIALIVFSGVLLLRRKR
jgi:hypothetical protein